MQYSVCLIPVVSLVLSVKIAFPKSSITPCYKIDAATLSLPPGAIDGVFVFLYCSVQKINVMKGTF